MLVVQGDAQQAQGGTELTNQIVVRLLGTDGAPVPDFPLGFVVAQGGGAVSPGSGLTDENGELKTKWTLGTAGPTQILHAKAGSLEPLVIAAFAVLPSDLTVAQGTNQTAKAGAALTNAIVVRVTGANNMPMKGVQVAFQVTQGGGLISPQSGTTNASGEMLSRWTLGPNAGVNTLTVTSGSLQPVTITAVGQ
jgi:hypothetical protein